MTIPLRNLAAPATLACVLAAAGSAQAAAPLCKAESGPRLTPVIELYTSEGCSSCPPADRWLSGLRGPAAAGQAVVQAFHVGYWDYIGWVDRFAAPSHTQRQRQIAAQNRLRSIYTPQLVRNGRDWQDYPQALSDAGPARATIALQRGGSGAFEAQVSPADTAATWSAYWTVTEHGHASRVSAGENKGEQLRHDFVVRQYTPVGSYSGTQQLRFNAIAADPAHPRQVNLVVFEPRTGAPLQAISLACGTQ